MNELNILLEVAKMGIGALFGIVILFLYRIDRKASEARLADLLKEAQEDRRSHTETLLSNTKVLTELVVLINRLNGKR